MTAPRRVLYAALMVALVASALAPPRALAAGTDAERMREARAHYEQAVAHYNLDEYAPALAEFREAYRLKPDPSFLFNIAQCHRRLGENQAALDFYRKYLRSLPNAPNRTEVERMIADLRAREASAPPVATTTPAPPEPGPAPVPELATSPAPTPAPLLEQAPVVAQPAPVAATPVYQRWWFWTAIGAVVVAGGVVGYAASRGPQPYGGSLGVVDLRTK